MIRPAISKTSPISCSQNRIVTPDSPDSLRRRRMQRSVSSGAIPAVGSSRTSISGLPPSATAISRTFWSPWESRSPSASRLPYSPTLSRIGWTSSAAMPRARERIRKVLRCRERTASWTFSKTVSLGKMFTTWKDREIPLRQMTWGGSPVISLPLNRMRPESGGRCPVMRWNSVVFPAPLGPMTATISPRSTSRFARSTARKPPKDRTADSTLSTPRLPGPEPPDDVPENAVGEEDDHEGQDDPEEEGPVPRVGAREHPEEHDGRGAGEGAEERVHPAQEAHDEHFEGVGPEHHVREDGAVDHDEEGARHAAEEPGDHDGGQLVPPHIDPDRRRPHGVVPDSLQRLAERGRGDPVHRREAKHGDGQREVVRARGRPERVGERDAVDAVVPPREGVPAVDGHPDQRPEGDLEHAEVQLREAHADGADDEACEGGGQRPGDEGEGGGQRGPRKQKRRAVGSDAVEDRVVELVDAAVSDGEVQARREQAGKQDDRGDVGVEPRQDVGQRAER